MIKVNADDFQKGFGRFRMRAHSETVIITNCGHDDLALISADEYKRLRRLDQQAYYASELPRQVTEAFGTKAISEEASQFDDEYPTD